MPRRRKRLWVSFFFYLRVEHFVFNWKQNRILLSFTTQFSYRTDQRQKSYTKMIQKWKKESKIMKEEKIGVGRFCAFNKAWIWFPILCATNSIGYYTKSENNVWYDCNWCDIMVIFVKLWPFCLFCISIFIVFIASSILFAFTSTLSLVFIIRVDCILK